MFSRLPLSTEPSKVPIPEETMLLMSTIPVMAYQVRNGTSRDPVLSRVKDFVLHGWKEVKDPAMKPYLQRQSELSIQDGCLLWGNHVIIPPVAHQQILNELHEGHPGISRMKSLARSFVWWPGLDQEVEEKVKKCNIPDTSQQKPQCTNGNYRSTHGQDYMLIMQVHLWDICS